MSEKQEQQEKVRFGLSGLAIAFMTENSTDAAREWKKPTNIPGAKSFVTTPEIKDVEFEADNIVFYKASPTTKSKLDLEAALIPDRIKAKMLGWPIDKNGAIVEVANGKPCPFALLYQVENDIKGRRNIFYNCTAAPPSTDNKTGSEISTEKIAITAIPVNMDDKCVIKASIPYGTKEKEVYNGWYEAVYVPEFLEDGGEEAEDGGGAEKPVAEMTVAELRAYAEAHGIDIEGLTLKADILSAVEAWLLENGE